MYAPSIGMLRVMVPASPMPASRKVTMPSCAGPRSTAWQLAGDPTHCLPTGQSELSRQMQVVLLSQNGVSPEQPSVGVQTTQTPLPLLAAVSQTGVLPPPQSLE